MTNDKSPDNHVAGLGSVTVDVRELLHFILAKYYVVLAMVVVVEAVMGIGGMLASSSYRAEGFVRMGSVSESMGSVSESMGSVSGSNDVPVAGLALAQTRSEFSRPAKKVSFYPRPAGTVLVVADANTAEEALSLVTQASEKLVAASSHIIKEVTGRTRKLHDLLRSQIQEVNRRIDELNQRFGENSNLGLQSMLVDRRVLDLMEQRGLLSTRIAKIEERLVNDVVPPKILKEPILSVQQIRPHWGRNFLLGAIFGVVFGCFVIALVGLFRQALARDSA